MEASAGALAAAPAAATPASPAALPSAAAVRSPAKGAASPKPLLTRYAPPSTDRCPACGAPPLSEKDLQIVRKPGRRSTRDADDPRNRMENLVTRDFLQKHIVEARMSLRDIGCFHGYTISTLSRRAKQEAVLVGARARNAAEAAASQQDGVQEQGGAAAKQQQRRKPSNSSKSRRKSQAAGGEEEVEDGSEAEGGTQHWQPIKRQRRAPGPARKPPRAVVSMNSMPGLPLVPSLPLPLAAVALPMGAFVQPTAPLDAQQLQAHMQIMRQIEQNEIFAHAMAQARPLPPPPLPVAPAAQPAAQQGGASGGKLGEGGAGRASDQEEREADTDEEDVAELLGLLRHRSPACPSSLAPPPTTVQAAATAAVAAVAAASAAEQLKEEQQQAAKQEMAAKQEQAAKQEMAAKQEQAAKQEMAAKQEQAAKQEMAAKQEQAAKQEMAAKQEQAAKQEWGQLLEGEAVGQEERREPAVKQEQQPGAAGEPQAAASGERQPAASALKEEEQPAAAALKAEAQLAAAAVEGEQPAAKQEAQPAVCGPDAQQQLEDEHAALAASDDGAGGLVLDPTLAPSTAPIDDPHLEPLCLSQPVSLVGCGTEPCSPTAASQPQAASSQQPDMPVSQLPDPAEWQGSQQPAGSHAGEGQGSHQVGAAHQASQQHDTQQHAAWGDQGSQPDATAGSLSPQMAAVKSSATQLALGRAIEAFQAADIDSSVAMLLPLRRLQRAGKGGAALQEVVVRWNEFPLARQQDLFSAAVLHALEGRWEALEADLALELDAGR